MKSDFVKQKSFDLIFKTKCDKKNDVFWERWVIVIGGEPQLLTTDDAMHCNGDIQKYDWAKTYRKSVLWRSTSAHFLLNTDSTDVPTRETLH